MKLRFNVFSNPQRLNLTGTERKLWLQPLIRLLQEKPTRVGRVLFGLDFGLDDDPWDKKDLQEVESLIVGDVEDRRVIAGHLSVLHEAVRLWSATTGKPVPFPHFLPPERNFDNPFIQDYAAAVSICGTWKSKLSQWIGQLTHSDSDPASRDLRLAAVLISAVVHGGIFGTPLLVALVRAIPEWKRSTFALDRMHIELALSRRGVLGMEHRIWLPDPLTAVLWCTLNSTDADGLLAPSPHDGQLLPPDDSTVTGRIGKLINRFRGSEDRECQPSIMKLRCAVREVALGDSVLPAYVAYSNTEFRSESLRRCDVGRLFPGEPLLEFERPAGAESQFLPVDAGNPYLPPEPAWMDTVFIAAKSKSVRKCFSGLASDATVAPALRLVASFGVSLGNSISRSGRHTAGRTIGSRAISIARSLGCVLDRQDLAVLGPIARRAVYLDAINRQPERTRRDLVQAIRDFDLYLVAQNPEALPVPRNSLPWLPKDGSVDPNLITHREYRTILDRIEAEWPARSGERRRNMAILLVVLAFRCGLRRGEMRGLRIEDELILGSEELQIRHRKADPLKTRNAERRLPICALLSEAELQRLHAWRQTRLDEGAKATDYLFAIPSELKRIPNSFFDQMNAFLRKLTPYANLGKGVHLHHLRHAAGAWLFTSLTLSDSERRGSLFPGLDETHIWMRNGPRLRQHLCRHTLPTRKSPFITASFCGHANFVTTASTYINIFPWLLAHALDGVESMRPDAELVRRVGGLPISTFRRWRRKGGLHNISVQLLAAAGAHLAPAAEDRSGFPGSRPAHSAMADNWLIRAWQTLMRRGRGETVPNVAPELQAMFERANWLGTAHDDLGHARHPLERLEANRTLPSPLKPRHGRNAVSLVLIELIGTMGVQQSQLLRDAVGVFAERHVRDGFVRFDSIAELRAADRYIEFLRTVGFEKRKMEFVSGTPDVDSEYRRQWRHRLSETYLLIHPCPPGRNYSPKESLWVRPTVAALEGNSTGPAGFRFTMAMAFIVFGAIPAASTSALPTMVDR